MSMSFSQAAASIGHLQSTAFPAGRADLMTVQTALLIQILDAVQSPGSPQSEPPKLSMDQIFLAQLLETIEQWPPELQAVIEADLEVSPSELMTRLATLRHILRTPHF